MSEHTPTPWKIRIHPEDEDYFYIHAEMTEDHPYNGVSSGIEIMSDEGYPRKRADAEFIVRACNNHKRLLEALKDLYRDEKLDDDDPRLQLTRLKVLAAITDAEK